MDGYSVVDVVLRVWFALTAVSVVYVAWDLIVRTPEMKVMKWGWVLVTLYTGPVALIVYWFSCREPAPGTHEKFIAPLWKQSVGSAIHCMAGDATGIIVAAAVTSLLGLPMGIDAVIEYVAGFVFGLFIFQALFMKDMLGGSYWQAVKGTWLPEWLSMNAVMAGMIPVMIILMTRDMRAMEPNSLRFWGIMSLASLVGGVLAYPVNWWLVKNGLKHGMGTERALGKGGAEVKAERARLATTTTATAAARVAVAVHSGVPAPSFVPPPPPPPPPLARNANHSSMPVSEMKEMSGMAGMKEVETSPQLHTAAMHRASEAPAPAPEMGGMKIGSRSVSAGRKLLVALITLAMLALGGTLAARYGDLTMRAGHGMSEMPMP